MSLDQVPYSVRVFWPDSTLIDTADVDLKFLQHLQRQPGQQTVVRMADGVKRGRRSTAHARNTTIYFLLPPKPEAGAEYELSQADGTLFFDRFTGHDFGIIDSSRPTHARVKVIRASPTRLRLRIDVSLTVVYEGYSDDPDTWREKFVLRETDTFRRGKD